MNFSVTNCAMEGFRLARRSPGALVVWALFYLLSLAVFAGVVFAFSGPALMEMFRNPAAMSQSDPANGLRMMQALGLGYFVGLFVLMFLMSILLGGVFRAVLTPEDKSGFAYMKVGARELKLYITMLVIGVITMVIYVLAAAVAGVASVAASHNGPNPLAGLLMLVFYAVLFLLWTGFSLSYPAAFMENGIRVFKGWRLAGANYWKLVAMYLLVILMIFGMGIVLGIAIVAIMAVVGGAMAASGGLSSGGMPAIGPGLIAAFVVCGLLYLAFGVMCAVLLYGAQAASYRAVVGPDAARAF